jgi:hypothetical protein
MADQRPTLNYAPVRQTNKVASRLLTCGTVLLIVSLLLMVLLPSGPLTKGWRIVLWAATACAAAGFLLDIGGAIHHIRAKRRRC